MVKFWFLLALCSAGCGGKAEVDPELQGYFEEFGREVAYAGNIPGKFVDFLEEDTVGECRFRVVGGKRFDQKTVFLRSAWDRYTETERKLLVFHELLHCLKGLSHDETVGPEGPESIMYPRVFELTPERFEILKERVKP